VIDFFTSNIKQRAKKGNNMYQLDTRIYSTGRHFQQRL